MTTSQMKKAINDFKRTLDKKDKDEWWGTEREIWNDISKKFLIWFDKNKKKFENDEEIPNPLTAGEVLTILNCMSVAEHESQVDERTIKEIAIKLGDSFPEIIKDLTYECLTN